MTCPYFSQVFIFWKVVDSYGGVEFPRHGALWDAAEVTVGIFSLLVTLSDVQKNCDEAEKKLRHKMRDLFILEDDMIHLEQQMQAGRDYCASITAEKTKLLEQIFEEEEKASMAQAQFDLYRRKMEGHRQAIMHAVGQTDICMQDKRALVQKLRMAKEELKEDLKNPNGNKVQMAKGEINALTMEVGVMRKNIVQMKENKQKVLETHAQIKKDIEGQNKHFETISKDLHCQIGKAQAVHRQLSRDLYHMERRKAELQKQLQSNYSGQC
ncbi:uncharacterized protein LOC133506796 isoform X3 [Syngnathoides biaculeatus]|uniref:uncharacterized protein LOC133506796 isoform X3 n=1 Tax=Syngnathoides biaculeatus TaxID=300417 RepID=UPI002ADDB62B|nr:uncharacterized protein LOC133506796 isoform X3 [Syngnathoides biaculeatus]